MVSTIDTIITEAKQYLPSLNEERLQRAYEFAAKAHENQVRFSGEPYITHPLEAAAILLSLKPDEDTLVAMLLHDVTRDAAVPLRDIEKAFGATVAHLVSGTHKLSLIKVRDSQAEIESWRRMFLAMAKDLRVVFIKLAERLHNMRTLEFVAHDKQQRIAQETLRLYAPIASRLGIYSLKSELEDLAFKFLYPKDYKLIKEQVDEYGALSHRYIEDAARSLERLLKEEGIEGSVSFRVKHLYSIYNKLRKKSASRIDDVHDLFAMRVVLPDQHREGHEFLGHCYTMLGILHNRWEPLPNRFKDYIAVPKPNGYRSLHTTVSGLLPDMLSQPVEIQIRTDSMHRESEYGLASHWWYEDSRRASTQLKREEIEKILQNRRLLARFYALLDDYPAQRMELQRFLSPAGGALSLKEHREFIEFLSTNGFTLDEIDCLRDAMNPGPRSAQATFFEHQIDWLYGLQQLSEELLSESDPSAASPSVNLFSDRIFVLTPEGDVKDLPLGATPIDFAYAVHTDVGNRCHQAKVNGRIVGLDYALNSGDIVDIVSRKNSQPNRYWLSFVKTSQARNKIKSWFRTQDREKNIKNGREMLNKELKRLGKPLLGPAYRLLADYGGKSLDLDRRENIVEAVGEGTLSVGNVLRTLFQNLASGRFIEKTSLFPSLTELPPDLIDKTEVLITGEDKLPVVLAACCKPKFPVSIVGYVTRGKSIRVHVEACRELRDSDPERLLEATWAALEKEPHYQVRLRIEAHDRVGLLRDILTVVAELDMSVVDLPLISKERGESALRSAPCVVVRDFIIDVPGLDNVSKLLVSLESVEGMVSVKKI